MERAKFVFDIPLSKARSPRDILLEEVLAALSYPIEDKRKLGMTLRLLKGHTPRQIRSWMSEARQFGRNPTAMFLWLLKKNRLQVTKKI